MVLYLEQYLVGRMYTENAHRVIHFVRKYNCDRKVQSIIHIHLELNLVHGLMVTKSTPCTNTYDGAAFDTGMI